MARERRIVRAIERRVLVLVTEVKQRDEPPGRGEWRTDEVVLAKHDREVQLAEISTRATAILADG